MDQDDQDLSEKINYIVTNQETIKFICLNDDLDYEKESTFLIIDEIKSNFYEILYPVCSRFENCAKSLPLSSYMYDADDKLFFFIISVLLIVKFGPRLLKILLRNTDIKSIFLVSK